ncbi:MAG: DEAD/DEAH box helicase [Verrucomicrobiales bacterium]
MPEKQAANEKAPRHEWPHPVLVESFASLTPDTQTVAIALATFGSPFHFSEIRHVLNETGARDVAGRSFSAIRAREGLKKLVAIGWVEVEFDDCYLIEAIINPLLELASRNDRLQPLATHYLRHSPASRGRRVAPARLIQHARIAFFNRDWNLLKTIETNDNCNRDGDSIVPLFLFLSPTPHRELLSRLPAEFLDEAVFQIGQNIARAQSPLADFLPQAYRFVRRHPEGAGFLCEILYLRGDIVRLEKLREMLSSHTEIPTAQIEAKQISGSIAFLTGHDIEAVARFREAAGLAGSLQGSKQQLVNGFAVVFQLLALARSGEDGISLALASIRQTRKIEEHPWERVILDLERAFLHATGSATGRSPCDWNEALPAELITTALSDLWCETVRLPDMDRFDRLMFDAENAAENSFAWLAAELYEIASRYAGERDSKIASEAAAAYRSKVSPTYTSIADTIRLPEAWEKTLASIEKIARKATPPSSGGEKATPQGRLAWVIDFRDEFPFDWELTPMEQKMGRTRKWNKPRPAVAQRLFDNPPPYLIDQDRQAIAKLVNDRSYDFHSKSDAAIAHLIGHPHLFLDEGLSQPIELARRDTQLVLQPASKGEIYMRLDPTPAVERKVTLSRDTPSRLFLTEITPAVKRLQELFGADGMTLPEKAKERLLKAVTSLAGEIEIQSQIGGTQFAQATAVEADATPQLHLIPHGSGLSAELLVQPIAGFGRHYLPGNGVETIFAKDERGENHQARRDLESEVAQAQHAVEACASLDTERDSPYRWTFPDPVDCLELLTDLHRLEPGLLSVHWPKGETFKLKAELETKQLRMALKSEKGWLRASGDLKVDDQLVLSMHELLEIAENDGDTGRFYQLKDGQFIALTEEFQRRLAELKAYSQPAPGKSGDLQINELAAYALEDLTANVQLKADKKWRDHLARLDTAQSLEVEVPASLRAELRPYQLDGFRWLAKLAHWGVGACLADDMGLGKTVQALALLLHRAAGGPALVIAPTSVATNWMREAARFAPTLNVQQFGPGDRAVTVADLRAFDLIICTFGLMQIESELLSGVSWHTVIIDEAQAIKNATTKRAEAALKLQADFRLITTGTPIENNLGELHSLFSFINPGLLGSREKFHRRFADPIQKTGNPQSRRWLKKLISPFILRRLKHEVLEDLPPRTEVVLSVEMSEEETAFYEAIRQRAVANIETQDSGAGEQGIRILAEITRLRRACCNPKLVAKDTPAPASSKLATFAETLDSLLDADHKVLVFSQFVDHLAILRQHLERVKIGYQYLDGSTPAKQRQKAIDAFQSGSGDVFLISLKAGGTGLNLTAADYVIHMDPWWNPASEDQASDRAHRIGQLRPVTVYRLVTKNTIEEKIVSLHHEKRDLANSLLAGTDTGRKLNPDELLALIRG